jgi:uncharacterized membrane protein
MSSIKTGKQRLLYLDWLRGFAALIMLQGHCFHSFLRNDLREGGPYVFSQFLGGMPPAIFLFLTGITLAFLMDSNERKGLPAATRVATAIRRAGYLFGIAFLFRLQLYLFGFPDSPAGDVLKVDILNCMGFAILVMSVMAFFRTAARVRVCALLGLAIALLSPVVSGLSWTGVPPLVKHYLAPDFNYFSFFPWAAYLAFGLSAGSVLRVIKREHLDRAMQWSAVVGMAVVAGAYYLASSPFSIYPHADFWLNSPTQVLIKQGVILMTLPLGFLWTEYGAHEGWSLVRQFGTTSLLVYWAHIELVYGRWLWFLKENLSVAQTVVWAIVIILLMLLISVARTHRRRWIPAVANWLRWNPAPARVPGD